VIDPTTGTVYQTTYDVSTTGLYTTRVVAITPTGTTTIATVPRRPRGAPVIDPSTGTVYQTTYDYDSATGLSTTRVVAITPTGTTTTTVPGQPSGAPVIDAPTGTVYQTTTNGVYVVGARPATPVTV
jgi:uncharacterized protein (DUF2147 family)